MHRVHGRDQLQIKVVDMPLYTAYIVNMMYDVHVAERRRSGCFKSLTDARNGQLRLHPIIAATFTCWDYTDTSIPQLVCSIW